ncbi:uncharacterized protein [Diadema antillarum]|uniref:uncharacterized protein n=1 Tax=Diadema antillarum TaxID=105358 RepID=UPI003A8480CC
MAGFRLLSFLVIATLTLVVAYPSDVELIESKDEVIVDIDPLPTPVGISNFVGVGYNIIDGNPEGGDIYLGGVDPGLLVTRPILKLTYDDNQLTHDRSYVVPDQVAYSPRTSCANSKTIQTFYGLETYTEKISVDVEQSARIKGVFTKYKFSSSSRYDEVRRGVEKNRYVFFQDRSVCNLGQARYRNELALYEKYPLDIGFALAACRLPIAYDETAYMQFLDDWGTHVVLQVDLGTKTTERYVEVREDFVHYARTEVDSSVSFRTKVFTGYRGAAVVDTDTLEAGLTGGKKFGSQFSNFTSGGLDLPEPIAVSLIGMHEVFDRDYWQQYQDLISSRVCTMDWMRARDTVQSNVELALNNYAAWRGVEQAVDPVIAIPVTWPKGTYTLPKPLYGCPNTHIGWAEGWRFHDTEDTAADNRWSDPLHLQGSRAASSMDHWFCSKTVEEEDIFNWPFQDGLYCVAKKGSFCPLGMNEGSVYWDDEDTSNGNKHDGELPSGEYTTNTRIDYCCMDDGFATNPIFLPPDEPFYLQKRNHQCQEVHGMTYTEEWFRWDTNDQANGDWVWGSYPYQGRTDNIVFEYCYYEPAEVDVMTASIVVALPYTEIDDHIEPQAVGDPKPTPVGISNFVGIGYNIIDGNPEGGDIYLGGVDPGLLVTRPVLKLTYDDGTLTADREYVVPDQVVFTPRSSCASVTTQQTFYGMESYIEKISVDVEQSSRVTYIFGKAKFTGSTRYDEVNAEVKNQRSVYYEDRTVCNRGQARYRDELAIHEQYPLDDGFVADVCRLPASYDEDVYMNFLDDWGTHVVTQVDLGFKTTDRYQETRENFVHYAESNVDESVNFKNNLIPGYRGAIEVDVEVFERGLTAGMKFGSQTSTFATGGEDLPEPIAVFLIGMHEVFEEDYWMLFDDYVKRGLCSSSWIQDLDTYQSNVEAALNGYAEWKNANAEPDPLVAIPIAWPRGTYTLPKPVAGCPSAHFSWNEGWRYHDTEDSFPDNHWSNPLHLEGPYANKNMYQKFCSKTVLEADIYGWPFQEGQYCVAKKGASCPAGLSEGFVYWDDEDTANKNDLGGDVPEGIYDSNTRIYYCCRDDGFASNPIYLPTDQPFFLYKRNHQCQEVHGMRVTEEYFRWDTNDTFNDDDDGGSHPYQGHSDNIILEYCYYEPLDA